MTTEQLETLCARLHESTVICVGDLMLDRYVYGTVQRISPEAPIPVLTTGKEEAMLGGAGNVARNLAALGARVHFFSVIGDDQEGMLIRESIDAVPGLDSELVVEHGRCTTVKTRFVAESQQILRTDRESKAELSEASLTVMSDWCRSRIDRAGALIVSDYGKGVITSDSLQILLSLAETAGVPVLVDPKGTDFSRYKGAFLITPNRMEFTAAAARSGAAELDLETAAPTMRLKWGIKNILVTLGAKGMLLADSMGQTHAIPTEAQEVYDVSGAGDTTIATVGAAIAAGADLPVAARLANIAAGVAVSRLGTTAVSNLDIVRSLSAELKFAAKLVSLSSLLNKVELWRSDGCSIGFTNGCFDLLHPGHVTLLHRARSFCDRLVVALNSDASIKRLKGEGRPIQNENARGLVIAALSDVDAVVFFDEDTPLSLIKAIRPDTLCKGADYALDEVVGASEVMSYGGYVQLIPLEPDQSTSLIVERLSTSGR